MPLLHLRRLTAAAAILLLSSTWAGLAVAQPGLRPAPPDIAAFPARLPNDAPALEPGVELHGFVAAWVTPWAETSAQNPPDTYRLRFGVLRVDARPARHVSVLARVGLMLPNSPLLDFALSYTPSDYVGVTVGQFRLPIGAAATTLGPKLVMLDRPSYVYAMTKQTFREVGVMIHSSERGIGHGVLHYRLMAAGGAGRLGAPASRPAADLSDSLIAARAIVDFAPLLGWPLRERLALGASYARSSDPAIATGDAARDRELAGSALGRTLAPIQHERVTQLAGADATLQLGPVYAQAELLLLHSRARAASVRRAGFGTSLDLAYTLPLRPWSLFDLQLASRAEHFNPRLGRAGEPGSNDEVQLLSLGLNALAGPIRASIFASFSFFEDAQTQRRDRASSLTLRAAASF